MPSNISSVWLHQTCTVMLVNCGQVYVRGEPEVMKDSVGNIIVKSINMTCG
jgi:hypothetical protein